MSKTEVSVDEFYRRGEVLLTGGTGFMGKILLDKLLRSLPDLSAIYLLVRNKKSVKPEERVEKMFSDVIFERLNKEVPNFRSKIHVIPGDIQTENLGLSVENKRTLVDKVNIIFHCAASVQFDKELQVAIKSNLYPTTQILSLAKQCRHLKMFTYVSTAYSPTIKVHSIIEEKIYTPKTPYRHLLDLLSLKPDDPRLIEARVQLAKENTNTYTTTKAASEELLSVEGRNCPVSIFRPSIIISTYTDPLPGYINNLYGPTGIAAGVAAGVVRSIYCDTNVIADLVPMDWTVNALVVSTVDAYYRYSADPTCLPVYNYVSCCDNPIKWGEFQKLNFIQGERTPPSKALMHCFCYVTRSKLFYNFLVIFLHYTIGYIFDFCFWLSGEPTRLIPIYRQIDKASEVLVPFSTRDWYFDNSNVHNAWDKLDSDTKIRFPFNIGDLDWEEYIYTYFRGLLQYRLKDSFEPDVRKKAMKRHQRLYIIHLVLKGVLYAVVAFLIWFLIRIFFGNL